MAISEKASPFKSDFFVIMIIPSIAENEAERLDALRRYDILDTPAEGGFDDITKLAAQICDVPIALVSLVDAHRQWFKSKVGLDAPETSRDISFCGHAIHAREILEIPNALEDERFRDNPLVIAEPNIRFYAGAPLATPDGHQVGTLCVIDRVPRQLTQGQRDALVRLGRQVVTLMELRLANRRLARKAAFQQSILRCADSAVIATTADGVITHFNPAAERMLGYTAEEMIGKLTPATFHDPTEVDARAKELARELGHSVAPGFNVFVGKARDGEPETREWTYVRHDGSRFPVLLSVSALCEDRGELIGFLGVARDITERKQAEMALRLEQRRLSGVIEGTNAGTWEWNVETGEAVFNERWAEIVGYTLAELAPVSVSTWLSLAHPDDLERSKELLERHFEGEIPYYDCECRMRHKDGHWVWVQDRGRVISRTPERRPLMMYGTHTDITASKAVEEDLRDRKLHMERLVTERTAELAASERRFRATFDSAAAGIAHVGEDGRLLRINQQFCNITGYPPAELARMTFEDITYPDDLAADLEQAGQLFSGAIDSYTMEKRYVRKDGTIVWINLMASVVRDDAGKIEYAVAVVSDITEIVQVRVALTESERRLRTLLSNLQGMAYRCRNDSDWTTEFASSGCLELLGFEAGELTSGRRTYASLVHPEDLPSLQAKCEMDLKSRLPINAEYRLMLPDGRLKWVWEKSHGIYHTDGRVEAIEGFISDITEYKRVQEAMAESERFSRAILDALSSHIAVLDERGKVVAVNSAWVQFAEQNGLFGTLVGVDYLTICDRAAAVSVEAGEMSTLLREILAGQRTEGSYEYPCHSPEEERWFLCRATRFAGPGPVRVALAHENITAIKQAQQRAEASQRQFRDLFEFAPDAILMTNAAGHITLVNQGTERMFGYCRDELFGQAVELLVPDTLRRGHVAMRRQYHANGTSRSMGADRPNLTGRKKDGTVFPVDISLSPMQVEGSGVVVAAIRDVTERKLAQDAIVALNTDLERRITERTAQLASAREAADAANRAKTAFLANMSHEIRTPLNAITGMAELLERTTDKDEQAKMLRLTRESAHALAGIIDDVLDLSKIEAGMLDVHREPVSLRDIVASTVALFSSSASAKNLYLRAAIDEQIPAAVYCDPLRLRQILFNLLGNAIKFTSAGGIDVRAFLEENVPAGAVIRMEVADTGIGLSEQAQARLFQPFVQAEADTTRKFGGTGLGLAISRRLAELLSGKLTLQSAPGKGTTMILKLTLALAEAKNLNTVTEPDMPAPIMQSKQNALSGLRLLIVDDNALNREVLSRQLKMLDCQADEAQDGVDALRMWRSGAYTLLVTDCHMPEMDGYQLTSCIREIEAGNPLQGRIPIIGYTADALQGGRERCLLAGMDDVLIKPVGLQALRNKLVRWLSPIHSLEHAAEKEEEEGSASIGTDPIDWQGLSEITGGDATFGRELLREFLKEKTSEAQRLADLLSNGDLREIGRLAHRMEGAARVLSAKLLAAICHQIELAANKGDRATLAATRQSLEQEFLRVKAYIEQAGSMI